jgi:Nif-specific regulatory protein
MPNNFEDWSIAFFKDGRRGEPVPLQGVKSTLGRDQSNAVVLPDASVSRVHAEMECTREGVLLRDCKSRNGIKVNGVPRKEALLQKGDIVSIGIYSFEMVPTSPSLRPRQKLSEKPSLTPTLEQTITNRLQLPDLKQDRQLSTLYHVCFWITEDLDREENLPRLLQLLLEGFRVSEVQIYNANLQLESSVATEDSKRSVKLAPFLAERCQTAREAMIYTGADFQKHQQRVGQYNYLVGPLRPPHSGDQRSPFLLLIKPIDWVEFTTEDRVLLQAICQLWVRGQGKVQQVQELRRENEALREKGGQSELLGESGSMRKLRERITKLAGTKATVLIHGETGSGKELVAKFIHDHSPRSGGPFVKMNCAAMPEGLVESELFGHAKGAFTDAKSSHAGKFSQASGGTLFLDEIGEMPLTVQSKVLRAIESGEIERIGEEGVTKVDVRIMAASHRNLADMVAQGRFREDLFYRLNVLTVTVPPLREHLEDLQTIAAHFLQAFCVENGLADMSFSKEAITRLRGHEWPGNVRELRNIVQRCAVEAGGTMITGDEVRRQLGG